MVAAISTTSNPKGGGPRPNPKRPPLLPSDADNGVVAPRKPKSREVTSRYLSSSISTISNSTSSSSNSSSNSFSSRRCQSPAPMTPRSQSVERQRWRPTTPDNSTAATKLLVASSRSASASFQGDSVSLLIAKAKPAPATNNLRKGTPERRRPTTPARDQTENSKPIENPLHRWPGRSRDAMINSLTRSANFSSDSKKKSNGSGSAETDSQSVNETTSVVLPRGTPRGIVVPARFWQETNNRLRQRVPEQPVSPVSKKFFNDTLNSSPRGVSPLRGTVRPSSAVSSPSRSMASPGRGKNDLNQSILSFVADVRRGKVGESRVVDAHMLRLLYNRELQWRFMNARADAAMFVQKGTAEKSLYNAWVATSKLQNSVKTKRVELQLLRQNLKLYSILKRQTLYLDDWDLVGMDHSSSLSGAIEALEASTLRLPIVGGARVDIQNVKDAICSAVDVMQAMASSICSLLTKVDQVSPVVSELANTTAKERALLDQCKDLLSTLTAMQVKDCSLRTHMVQLRRVPSSLTNRSI